MSRTAFVEEAEAFLARLEWPDVPAIIRKDRAFVVEQMRDMIERARTGELPPRGQRSRGLWRILDHWPMGREPGGDLSAELVRLERMYDLV